MSEKMNLPVVIPKSRNEVTLPRKPLRVIGIDLGTTNSTVAELRWDPEKGAGPVRCLEVAQTTTEGEYTHILVPSVIALWNGQTLCGEGAKRLRSKATELGLVQNKNLFYECKNDIGIKRTYHMAPAGFSSAAEIGGHVLEFLKKAAEEDGDPIAQVVVTVPASFQTAQRTDTLKAAELAGIPIKGGNLLDEPISAFLDYLATANDSPLAALKKPKRLVVFDFGGGTCDIAVFRVKVGDGPLISAESLSVSRYHRLGGGDIDAAIVYNHLIPELCKQNGIALRDLGYAEKKRYIEPALLSVAESLKVGLCSEIRRLIQFDRYENADKASIVSRQPGQHSVKLPDSTLALQSPCLTAEEFDRILAPFIDTEALFARETEYHMTCSIFAPISDALDRAGLAPNEVDYCLLVGGSSLIPQVETALRDYFSEAELLTFPDKDAVLTAVARGAAYHALALALCGRGLITPVCHESIHIRTANGSVELVPNGTELPYPEDGGTRIFDGLVVPEDTVSKPVSLRVELLASAEGNERLLFSNIWELEPPVRKGTPLRLEYSMDQNQLFDFRLYMSGVDEKRTPFGFAIENPLTNVVNPQVQKLKIEQIEENLRTEKVPKAKVREVMLELADLYSELRQQEKAVEFLKRLLRTKNTADPGVLNKIGILYQQVGDAEKAERYYTEAGAAGGDWGGGWFNLSLLFKDQNRLDDALEAIDKGLDMEQDPPYLVQKAIILDKLGRRDESRCVLAEAMANFDPPASLNDWELGWYVTGAAMAGEEDKRQKAEAIRRRRKSTGVGPAGGQTEGSLPAVAPSIVKR